ncbi:MAG: ECF transporter S component [Eubacterium sp.]|nr:ECF transporter S component [Eubacterium sp.]
MTKIEKVSERVVYTGLFLALGLLLPQLFHFLPLANAGKMLLPMHIPTILAGYMLGSRQGAIVGCLSPLLSCLMFQMPAFLMMPAMCAELMTYGIVAGLVSGKIKNNILSLMTVMISGRIVNCLMYVLMINLLGITKLNMEMFFASLTMGVPGIILQIALIPPMISVLNKFRGEF